MYCTKCGKRTKKESKFCQFCGQENLIKKEINSNIHTENDEDKKYVWTCDYCGEEFNTKFESDNHEKVCDKNPKNNRNETNSIETNKNISEDLKGIKPGFRGWLAVVGLALIIGVIRQAYALFGYFSLFSDTYEVPGYSILLGFEFLMLLIYVLLLIYSLFLYFKKDIKFPKYYIISAVYAVIYSIIDYVFVSSLTFPVEAQQSINETLSETAGVIGQDIISAIIWIPYMKKSKQVRVTFVKKY